MSVLSIPISLALTIAAGSIGEKIGRNKTGNIPIVSDIGGAVGRQKGTDMYDKFTAPFRKEEVSSYDYWKQFVD